ncbi:MAG: SUMF1/EgtB/PvdO family nonheme iron enzyme [Solirubrobacteraceae bacterium]
MVGNLDTSVGQRDGAEQVLEELAAVRGRTLELVAHIPTAGLEASHSPLMSPLVWDLAHIAAYEDLWLVHRHAGEPLLHPELAAAYDAFETPRDVRAEIELLDAERSLSYLDAVRARTVRAAVTHGVGDGLIHELVLRHELQHTETMLQTMAIAGLPPPPSTIDRIGGDDARAAALRRSDGMDDAAAEMRPRRNGDGPARVRDEAEGGRAWIRIDGGRCSIGAEEGGFAYDNERPRHEALIAPYEIAAEPVSNGDWRRFCEEGGYERREHWSAEGWRWREQADPLIDPSTGIGGPEQPVCHLCFHEAEALARGRRARLPSEAEWEHAVASAGERLLRRRHVWEWTSSEFDGYDGFVAYPYREYSEVFFRKGYRVLRGGSWASSERIATDTFRNWDLPIRRQIFAGVRLARDT